MDRRKISTVTIHYDDGTVITYTRNFVEILKGVDGRLIYRSLSFNNILKLAADLFGKADEGTWIMLEEGKQ